MNKFDFIGAVVGLGIMVVITYSVLSALPFEDSGTIISVEYNSDYALVWINLDDDGEVGPLEYRAMYWKVPRKDEHLKLFRWYADTSKLIDFWYDNEEVFFESTDLLAG